MPHPAPPVRTRARTRLANGLTVIAEENPAVPAVAVNLWYRIGSRHEHAGRTGLAHLFEHLMFQGSTNVAAGEHMGLLQAIGADLNATTSFDRTNYFETVPSRALDLALWLEADRMAGLLDALDQVNLDNQRDVVKNERRQRYDNQPYGAAFEELFRLLFPAGHHYHHLPIGSMADLDAASLEDVADFFRTHYAPANAVLTVVGDLPVEQALAAVQERFDQVPAGPGAPPQPETPTLAPLTAPVTTDLPSDVPAAALYLAWRAPVDGDPEADALDLALQVLIGGAASRIFGRLVRRERLCQNASGGLQRLVAGNSAGLMSFRAYPDAAAEPTLAAIEVAVAEELERFAAEGPDAEELAAALAQLERDWLGERATLAGAADQLSRYACLFGDPELADGAVERLRGCTPDQVRAAAARWLQPQQRAALRYLPTAEEGTR